MTHGTNFTKQDHPIRFQKEESKNFEQISKMAISTLQNAYLSNAKQSTPTAAQYRSPHLLKQQSYSLKNAYFEDAEPLFAVPLFPSILKETALFQAHAALTAHLNMLLFLIFFAPKKIRIKIASLIHQFPAV